MDGQGTCDLAHVLEWVISDRVPAQRSEHRAIQDTSDKPVQSNDSNDRKPPRQGTLPRTQGRKGVSRQTWENRPHGGMTSPPGRTLSRAVPAPSLPAHSCSGRSGTSASALARTTTAPRAGRCGAGDGSHARQDSLPPGRSKRACASVFAHQRACASVLGVHATVPHQTVRHASEPIFCRRHFAH